MLKPSDLRLLKSKEYQAWQGKLFERGKLLPLVHTLLGNPQPATTPKPSFAVLIQKNFNFNPLSCILCGCEMFLSAINFGNVNTVTLLQNHRALALMKKIWFAIPRIIASKIQKRSINIPILQNNIPSQLLFNRPKKNHASNTSWKWFVFNTIDDYGFLKFLNIKRL